MSHKNRNPNRDHITENHSGEQPWAPDALTQLSRALLTADKPRDVLSASLKAIRPTDISGATILLSGGSPENKYMEIAATWQNKGLPPFPVGTQFTPEEGLFKPLSHTNKPIIINDVATDQRLGQYMRSELLHHKITRLVALPLGSETDQFGTLLINRSDGKRFGNRSVNIYQAVAALMTGAIEKLWLIQKTQQTLDKTLALYKISRRLSEAKTINEILMTVLSSDLFGAAGGTIALLEPTSAASKAERRTSLTEQPQDQEDQELVFWAAAGAGAENILGMHMPTSEGVVGWVVRENQSALVPDAYADERFYQQMDEDIAFRTHSILCAPLRVEGQVIGAIELVDLRPEYLNEEGLRLLDQVAQQVALFIQNQRLLAETQRQAHDLTRLLEIGKDLASTLDRDQAANLLTSRVLELVQADGCHLFLLQSNPGGKDLLLPVSSSSQFADQVLETPLRVGQGITGRVAQSGVGEMVNRSDLDPRSYKVPGTPSEPESLISVPLVAKDGTIGVMTVTRLGEKEFVEQDLRIVEALSGYATTMLTNSRLFEEVQQRSEALAALNSVISTASQSLTLEEILDATLEQVDHVMSGSAGLICQIIPQTGKLELATERNLPPVLARHLQEQGMGGTLCEVTIEKGKTYCVHDLVEGAPIDTSGMVKLGLRTYLGTPLVARGEILGTLSVFGTEPHIFTPADAALLTAIGQQVGIAVRNARLYEQTERALAESTALYEASQAISTTLDLEDVLQITVSYMANYVDADQCRLVLFDEALGYGQVKAEYRPTPDIEKVKIPMAGNPSYEVLNDTGQPIAIEDVRTHPITKEVGDMLSKYGVKSTLLVPLIVQGRLIGSVGLDSTRGHRVFSEAEINFCRTLADRAALAAENRRLFAQTQDTLHETRMLYQASRALNQAYDLDDVLHAILDNLPIRELDQCWIALLKDAKADAEQTIPHIEIRAMWDHEGDESLLGTRFTPSDLPIFSQNLPAETFVIDDLEDKSRFDPQSAATLQELGVKSALIIPLLTGDTLLGWLFLITHHVSLVFGPEQIHPYQALADQAAVAIQNQQLLKQVQESLEEVATVHRQYLRKEWSQFLEARSEKESAILYDRGNLVSTSDYWHPLINESLRRGSVVAHDGTAEPHSDNPSSEGALGDLSPQIEALEVTPSTQDAQEPDVGAPKEDGTDNTDRKGNVSMVAPLKVRGEIIGVLGLEDTDTEAPHKLTDEQISMVEEVADQVALAIENARLLETTQATLSETARLYEAASRLSNIDEANEVLQVLAEEVQSALGPTYSGSILCSGPDPADHIEWFELNTQWDGDEKVRPVNTRLPSSAYPTLSRFVGRRDTFVLQETETSDKDLQAFLSRIQARTLVIAPMASGDSWLGMVQVASQRTRKPDERTMRFLQNLADRAAVALESIRLYDETQRRAVQLEAASKVSRAATSILEQDKLLPSVVELIRDHFNYYHAQIFLIDATENWAVLKASTGKIGERLLQRGHALEVGGASVIGTVTVTGEPRIAHDVGTDPIHFRNELLPNTRSEMAIPLKIGGRVIGALDVQSVEPNAFSPDDVAVLSTLADQLATAIENARLYQEQLEAAEKLREVDRLKSQFLANMSHELRTPLNSIIGFSRVILKGIDGPVTDLQKQDLTAIYNSGQHLLELINNILDLSKIEAGKMDLSFEEVNLDEIIKGVISTAIALVKDKPQVELKHEVDPDLPLVIADATRVRQVLLNLLSNAAKFTEEGYIKLRATCDERNVTVKVSDSGIGIPPDKFDVIFQEFEQVDGSTTRSVGGTGLGLPISRHFVEMHGGEIWVESEVGVGSTFTVRLPIKGPQAVEEEVKDLVPDPTQHLVLCVDDDESVIKLYKRYLEKQNYQVTGLPEGKQVVALAKDLNPYAILLDLLMPEKDGWSVIKDLKADPETQNIPVIICSIVSDTGRGFSMGAADYLVKPVMENQLLSSLERLAEWSPKQAGDKDSSAPRQVLIIDDTPEDRQLLRRALKSTGESYTILEASGGMEGIDIIQEQRPDLVVLDLMMPEMDGFAVLETLKRDKDTRQIPIVIVTAKELTEQERTQINGQVAALFQKGLFKEDELLQDVDQALRRVRKSAKHKEKVEEQTT